jgi:hypothetical protein
MGERTSLFFISFAHSWPRKDVPRRVGIKTLASSKGYHVVAITDIHVSRMVRRLESNTGKYTGGGNVTALGRCEGFDPWDIFPWPECRGLTYGRYRTRHVTSDAAEIPTLLSEMAGEAVAKKKASRWKTKRRTRS